VVNKENIGVLTERLYCHHVDALLVLVQDDLDELIDVVVLEPHLKVQLPLQCFWNADRFQLLLVESFKSLEIFFCLCLTHE
jgi:hypothetical protein